MKNRYAMIMCVIVLFLVGCRKVSSVTDVYRDMEEQVVDVSSQIVPIRTNLLLGNCRLHIAGDYLLLKDLQSSDMGIYLLDKDTFEYITSIGKRGRGPGEIVSYKQLLLIPGANKKMLYGFDYSKLNLWGFSMDSVKCEGYLPQKINTLSPLNMGGRMKSLNDSIFLGRGMSIVNKTTFMERMSKYNLKTGKILPYGYKHPELKTNKDSRAYFALSKRYNQYVNCYIYQDLMTICKNDGTLICNVYGKQWKENKKYQLSFFSGVDFYKNKIIASYIGNNGIVKDKYKRFKGALPTRFLVFDLHGKYLKTIDTHHEINNFCVDEDNNRLIVYFADTKVPLAYLDLKGLVD